MCDDTSRLRFRSAPSPAARFRRISFPFYGSHSHRIKHTRRGRRVGDRRDGEASGVTLTHHGNIGGAPSFIRLHDCTTARRPVDLFRLDRDASSEMRLTSHHGDADPPLTIPCDQFSSTRLTAQHVLSHQRKYIEYHSVSRHDSSALPRWGRWYIEQWRHPRSRAKLG